jgi:hypothetical protein
LYLIGAHVFLIALGFAGQDQIPLYKELWQFLTLYDWMWFALAGFVLMVLAGVTSYKKARAKMVRNGLASPNCWGVKFSR